MEIVSQKAKQDARCKEKNGKAQNIECKTVFKFTVT